MERNSGDARRLTARPAVVLVWSYKGGQGRSWAAANTAYWLARKGHRIVLADLDYRAPGLPYFVLNMLRRPDKTNLPPGVGEPKRGLPSEGGVELGFLEAAVRFWHWARERDSVSNDVDELWNRLGEPLPDLPGKTWLKQLMWTVPFEAQDSVTGSVFFAPCGDITDSNFQRFVGEGNPFRQVLHPGSDPGRAAPVQFTNLLYVALARMADEVQADFVVIDLPAGVSALTEMLLDPPDPKTLEGLFRFSVPGVLLAVTSPAAQAIDGTRRFLNGRLTERVSDDETIRLPPILRDARAFVLFNMQSESGTMRPEELAGFDLAELTDSQRREILTDQQSREPVSDWTTQEKDVLRILDRACFCPWIDEGAFREFIFPAVQTRHHRIVGGQILSDLLASHIDTIEIAMRPVLHVIGTALQRYLNRGQLVPAITRRTESTDSVPQELVLFGEDVPAFRAFCGELSRLGLCIRSHFAKHEDLLRVLLKEELKRLKAKAPGAVDRLRDLGYRPATTALVPLKSERFVSGVSEPVGEQSKSLDWILANCHLAGFPHYLLGNLWTNRRKDITLPAKVIGDLQVSLDAAAWAFGETCTYRGQWLMLPLTLLTKLLIVRGEPTAVTRWTWPQLQDWLPKEPGTARLLTESRLADSRSIGLSLWYEWNQFLISCGETEVTRDEGHDLGRVRLGRELTESRYHELLSRYRELTHLAQADDLGTVSWENAGVAFHKHKYAAWLGWTDWLSDLSQSGKLNDCGFLPLPKQEAVFPTQPVEGWGLVITKAGGNLEFLPDIIRQFLAIDWQISWQAAGGCSPFIDVIRNQKLQSAQPWLLPTAITLERVVPKGKTVHVPLEIAAVATYVSQHLGPHRQREQFDILKRLLEELVDNDS